MHVLRDEDSGVGARAGAAPSSRGLGTVSVEATLLPGTGKSGSAGPYDRVRFKSVLFQHATKGVVWKIDCAALKNTREISL
jgi:hypothetical protein